ncbi:MULTISPECIES: acyltransferase family protein [Bradyrhizobium]|uniref:acyltransferase family protein n=1 Tax=Bradyrhizobium TaxID=374 RepID=UPI001B8A398A|nr:MULTISPECIES: acyltransferase [Bradyrhizobium]MBR0969930.1 acyltransferase [Bradyrhizobium japonicum]
MKSPGSRHYPILDVYRAIASLAVLIYHIAGSLQIASMAIHAYLAVDFFFLLSGFVIDRAYGMRLEDPSFKFEFLLRRFVRLWPMIILGTLVGAAVSIGGLLRGHALDLTKMALVLSCGLLLLPFGRMPLTASVFPFDGPLWSLFYEVVANVVYCFAFRWLRIPVLSILAVLFAVGLVVVSLEQGDLELGARTGEVYAGLLRVGFSFFAGVLMSRIGTVSIVSGPTAVASVVVLVGVFIAPLPQHPMYDVACILVVFPVLIWGGAGTAVPPGWRQACRFAGELSYPLYAVHYPITRIFFYFQETLALGKMALALSIVLEVITCLGAAYVATKFVDQPVRDRLGLWVERIRWPRVAPLTGST